MISALRAVYPAAPSYSTSATPSSTAGGTTAAGGATTGTTAAPGATTGTAGTGSAAEADPITQAAGGKLGKDEFVKLLVAQMTHQDPLNPMDGQQLAAQLAQFSSVEQLMNINQALQTQTTAQNAAAASAASSAALATIGHMITAPGDQITIDKDGKASTAFKLGSAADKVTVHIHDSSGKEVGSVKLGGLGAGTQTVDLSAATSGLKPGNYTYSVDATDAAGASVDVTTYTVARVTGMRNGDSGPVLLIGTTEVPYSSVIEIGGVE